LLAIETRTIHCCGRVAERQDLLSGFEFPLSFPLPSSVAPRRIPGVACADISEALMTQYGTRLGLHEISGVVLAVLKEHREAALSAARDDELVAECARRLDRLCVPGYIDHPLLPSGIR
jgi:hypothetical protein